MVNVELSRLMLAFYLQNAILPKFMKINLANVDDATQYDLTYKNNTIFTIRVKSIEEPIELQTQTTDLITSKLTINTVDEFLDALKNFSRMYSKISKEFGRQHYLTRSEDYYNISRGMDFLQKYTIEKINYLKNLEGEDY